MAIIQYRAANHHDLELAYKIKVQSLKPYIEQIWGWDENMQRELHQQRFHPANTTIIMKGQIEVGFYELSEKNHYLHIDNILIVKSCQSQGIGQEVLNKIISRAIDHNQGIDLQVFKINSRAKEFYLRNGFEVIGEREYHFVMRREVQS